jgi:heme/copper-type cytochrome/quinol oxidase subunit 2
MHHGITIIICLSPVIEKEFEWHAGLALTVEIQTVFLTLNRLAIDKTNSINKIINMMFYILFIAFRVFIFPTLTVYYYIEHQKYSVKCNTQINIAITAVIGFSIITLMGFMWIYKFITQKQIYKKINNRIPFSTVDMSNKTKRVKLSFTS